MLIDKAKNKTNDSNKLGFDDSDNSNEENDHIETIDGSKINI